ncbi:MAG: DNA polymerase [Chrysiogenia bacterium]
MIEKYAIFFLLPFEHKVLCVYEINSVIRVALNHKLQPNQEVVCISFDDYLHCIKNTNNLPKKVFDINIAMRILCGEPASKYNNENAPWKGISCLGKHINDNVVFAALKSIEKGKYGNYKDWIKNLPIGWEHLLINALKCEHQRLIAELKKEGVFEQFVKVEMELKCVFAKTGIRGIEINTDKLNSKYCELDIEYFKAVKILEIQYGFNVDSQPGKLSFKDIKNYVTEFSSEDFSKKYFWETIEFMQESSEFLKNLLIEYRNRRDLAELERISSSISQNCRIEYDIFGTVSGRILLTRPGIQYLKRTSRDIFIPTEGFEFIYADYAQFEPGILASFSGDNKLMDLYNSGDVYTGLANEIGGACSRKIAKELFLSFIYGMTKDNIRRKIVNKFGDLAGNSADSFFNQFDLVNKWKTEIINAAKINKIVKGPFSYLRRVSSDDTDNDIEHWAPNHFIQSTASGIFKKALCKIATQLKECKMLVPMHDAILLECPVTQTNETRKQIENIMIDCFQETCTGIKVRISFEPFAYDI